MQLDYDSLMVRAFEWSRANTVSVPSCLSGFKGFIRKMSWWLPSRKKKVWVKAPVHLRAEDGVQVTVK